jgi:hypothetical protein
MICLANQVKTKVSSTSAKDWDTFDFLDCVKSMHEKYVGKELNIPTHNKQWNQTADTFIDMCIREDIDPEIWIEAQLCLLSKFLQTKPLYPTVMLGKNAIIRYEKYRDFNKRNFKNIKARHSTDLQEVVSGETSYGTLAVQFILTHGRKAYTKEIRNTLSTNTQRSYPAWSSNSPERVTARPKALLNVLGSYSHEFAFALSLKRDFKWSEIAQFLKEQIQK